MVPRHDISKVGKVKLGPGSCQEHRTLTLRLSSQGQNQCISNDWQIRSCTLQWLPRPTTLLLIWQMTSLWRNRLHTPYHHPTSDDYGGACLWFCSPTSKQHLYRNPCQQPLGFLSKQFQFRYRAADLVKPRFQPKRYGRCHFGHNSFLPWTDQLPIFQLKLFVAR